MAELSIVDFPELFGTHLSDEDRRLLDLWDQGLDCDVISCMTKNKSQETSESGFESDEYSYIYGDHSDDELSDSDYDSDSDESSESDSGSESDSDSDSESSDADDDEDYLPVRKCIINPIRRRKHTARSMRIQLLKHLTLSHGFDREEFCCEEECSVLWRWVRMCDVYLDYD